MSRWRALAAAAVLMGSLAGAGVDAAQLPSPPQVIHRAGAAVDTAAAKVRHTLTPAKRRRVRRVRRVRHTPVRHVRHRHVVVVR